MNGIVAQLVRAPACHAGGCEIVPRRFRHQRHSSMAEHRFDKAVVVGSSPTASIN
jgi:hypothetical protein